MLLILPASSRSGVVILCTSYMAESSMYVESSETSSSCALAGLDMIGLAIPEPE